MTDGVLTFTVFPTYVGVSQGDPGPGPVPLHEPWDEFDYERGQIWWGPNSLGKARVYAPKGTYTHFVFCSGFTRDTMMGSVQMEQPIDFPMAGIIDVDPIHNDQLMPRGALL